MWFLAFLFFFLLIEVESKAKGEKKRIADGTMQKQSCKPWLYLIVHHPIAFSKLWSLIRHFKPTMASFVTPFSSLVHMHSYHLAMNVIISQDHWITNTVCVHGDREGLSHPLLTQFLTRHLVNDSSANTTCIYWGNLWGQTCCSVIDGKLQLKHASATDKRDINKAKNVMRCRDSRSAKYRETSRDDSMKQFSMLSSLPCFPVFCWFAISKSPYIF